MKKMYFSALFMVFLINAGSSTALAAKAQNVLFVGNSDESTLTPGKYIASVDIQFIVADNIPKYVDTGLPILNVESFVDYVTKGSILGYTTAGELVFYSVLGGRKKQFSFTSGRQNPGCAGKAVVDANYVIALHDCNGEVYYSMEEAKSAHTNYHLEIVQGSLHMINTETSRKLWSIVPPGEVHFPLDIEYFDEQDSSGETVDGRPIRQSEIIRIWGDQGFGDHMVGLTKEDVDNYQTLYNDEVHADVHRAHSILMQKNEFTKVVFTLGALLKGYVGNHPVDGGCTPGVHLQTCQGAIDGLSPEEITEKSADRLIHAKQMVAMLEYLVFLNKLVDDLGTGKVTADELFDFFFSAEFGDRELIAELEQGVIDIVNNLEVDEFGAHNERFLADEDDLDGRALEFFDDVKDYWVKGKVAVLSGQNKDLLRFDFAPLEITADIGSMWTDFMKKHKMLSSLGDHWLNSLKLRTFFTVPAWDETSKTASWGVRIRLQNLAGLVTSTPNQVRALKADLEVYMSFS